MMLPRFSCQRLIFLTHTWMPQKKLTPTFHNSAFISITSGPCHFSNRWRHNSPSQSQLPSIIIHSSSSTLKSFQWKMPLNTLLPAYSKMEIALAFWIPLPFLSNSLTQLFQEDSSRKLKLISTKSKLKILMILTLRNHIFSKFSKTVLNMQIK